MGHLNRCGMMEYKAAEGLVAFTLNLHFEKRQVSACLTNSMNVVEPWQCCVP